MSVPAHWLERQAAYRDKAARAEAGRRERFPDLFSGKYGLDYWRKTYGATVAWVDHAGDVWGDQSRSFDANAESGIPYQVDYQRANESRVRVGKKVGAAGLSKRDAQTTETETLL